MTRQVKWVANRLPEISGIHRFGLWLLLILLTLTLLLFPTHLTLEYSPIQSLEAIVNLPLFAVLFCVWLLLLLLLLFFRGQKTDWEKPLLVGIFALVFSGFWLVTGPNTWLRYDGIGNATVVNYLLQSGDGHLPLAHPNLGYFQFPGMHLLALSICQVSELEVSAAVSFLLVFQLVLLSVLVYILFLKCLKNTSLAALGALLVIQGNINLARCSFYPGIWALVFLVMLLILLNKRDHTFFETWQDKLIMVILLVTTTMTHLVTSTMFFLALLGIYLIKKLPSKDAELGKEGSLSVTTLALCLVVILAWEIYRATALFGALVHVPTTFVKDFTEGRLWDYIFIMGESYVGARVPLWATITRTFWWVALYIFGVILGLKNLFKVKELSSAERKETGGLLGLIFLTIATLFSKGGAEYYRFLLYGAFFTVPIILRFLYKLPRRHLVLTIAAIFFIVFSFPTFLAHNNLVALTARYPSEVQAARFVNHCHGDGDELSIFDFGGASVLQFTGVTEASFRTTAPANFLSGADDFWQSMERVVIGFEGLSDASRGRNSIFFFSKKGVVMQQHFFGIEPTDAKWKELLDRLASKNKIYDNEVVQIYAP